METQAALYPNWQVRKVDYINDAGLSDCIGDLPPQDQVEHCEAWILNFCQPQQSINYHRTSYGLKHSVENWKSGLPSDRSYVSNGAFIMAAVRLGYKYVRVQGLNAHFNMKIRKDKSREQFV
jgi:hypothetical protein